MASKRIPYILLVPLLLCLQQVPLHAQTNAPPTPPPAPAQPPAPAAQTAAPQQRPKMVYLGAFDAGQPGVGIYKIFDPTDQILCYVLMPEVASRRVVGQSFIYDGNTIGSLSCVNVGIKSKATDDSASAEKKKK